ncbi:MAG: SDR family oxidoreductase [Mariprofundales bacterium]
MNIWITGANRGLGLGFAQHYLSKGDQVWCCYRQDAGALLSLQSAYPNKLHLVQWDVTQELSCPDCIPQQDDGGINLLINNAGVYGPVKGGQDLAHITRSTMQNVFATNCIAPLFVTQTLKDALIHGSGIIANISSKMGSTADNGSGGTYAYRASKAALVIVSRSLGMDLKDFGVHVITLHPGWVQTEMTGFTGLITVDASIRGMTEIITKARNYQTGSFIAYDGKIVPY